jgi:hypothetical protein
VTTQLSGKFFFTSRIGEQVEGHQTKFHTTLHLAQQIIDRIPVDARHRSYFRFLKSPFHDKQGEYQVGRAHMRFLHHLADHLALPISSGSL